MTFVQLYDVYESKKRVLLLYVHVLLHACTCTCTWQVETEKNCGNNDECIPDLEIMHDNTIIM